MTSAIVTAPAEIVKDIRRVAGEWDVYIDGEYIGTRQFKFEAELLADSKAHETLMRRAAVTRSEVR